MVSFPGKAALVAGLLIAAVATVFMHAAWRAGQDRGGAIPPPPSEQLLLDNEDVDLDVAGRRRTPLADAGRPGDEFQLEAHYSWVIGRLVNASGVGLAKATVRVAAVNLLAYSDVDAARFYNGVSFERYVVTDDNGRFRVDGIPAESVGILVSITSATLPELILRIAVAPAGMDLGDITVQEGGTIEGTVNGIDGSPIADAAILSRQDGELASAPGHQVSVARANGAGIFRTRPLSPGVVRLAVSAPGWASEWSQPIRVRPGCITAGVQLKAYRTETLYGRVVDKRTHKPVEARVVLNPLSGTMKLAADTAPTGDFAISGVRSGIAYAYTAEAAGYYANSGSNLLTPQVIEDGAFISIALEPEPLLQLAVLDDGTERPICGAELRWIEETPGLADPNGLLYMHLPATARSAMDGRFDPLLARNHVRCVLSAPGYAPSVVRLPRGSAELATYRLMPGGALQVIVVASAGDPVYGALVDVCAGRSFTRGRPSADGPQRVGLLRNRTDQRGMTRFDHLPRDVYLVSAQCPGYASSTQAANLSGSVDVLQLTLTMASAACLEGTLQCSRTGGSRLSQTHVVRAWDANGLVAHALIGADNTFRLDNLPAGGLRIAIYDGSPNLESPQRLSRTLDLALDAGKANAVTVVDACAEMVTPQGSVLLNDALCGNLEVRLEPRDEVGDSETGLHAAIAPVDEVGYFELQQVPRGQYDLSVWSKPRPQSMICIYRSEVALPSLLPLSVSVAASALTVRLAANADQQSASMSTLLLEPDSERGGVPGLTAFERWRIPFAGEEILDIPHLAAGHYIFSIEVPNGIQTARLPVECVAGQHVVKDVALD